MYSIKDAQLGIVRSYQCIKRGEAAKKDAEKRMNQAIMRGDTFQQSKLAGIIEETNINKEMLRRAIREFKKIIAELRRV